MSLEPYSYDMPVSSEYVMSLEKRVAQLEDQLQRVQQTVQQPVSRLNLPTTQLISPNFLTRAFAVWGHYFVAQLMISLVFVCLYLVLMALGIGLGGLSLLGNN